MFAWEILLAIFVDVIYNVPVVGVFKWLKIFDKSKPPDAKLANGGFALAKILNPVYIS